MTNLARKVRIQIASLVIRFHRAGTYRLVLLGYVLKMTTEADISLDKKRCQRGFEEIMNAAANWQKRVASIMPELQTLNNLTANRKSQVLAAASALHKEFNHLRESASELQCHRVPGAAVLLTMAEYGQHALENRRRKSESFGRLILSIDSNTFYSDLLLWLVVPGASYEALVGDLKEEFLLRQSTEGEARALAWYRYQVATTVKDCFWTKVERFAQIGTLLDLLNRWLRK